jgi:hypothetical protein
MIPLAYPAAAGALLAVGVIADRAVKSATESDAATDTGTDASGPPDESDDIDHPYQPNLGVDIVNTDATVDEHEDAGAADVGTAEANSDEEAATQDIEFQIEYDEPDSDDPNGEPRRITKTITGSAFIGKLGDAIRVLGIDRHREAQFIEDEVGKMLAQHLDGELVETTANAFAPDGGIDVTVITENGKKIYQVKHHGTPTGADTVSAYEHLDGIFSSNGFRDSAAPSDFGLDGFSYGDLSWSSRLKLEGGRFINGLRTAGRAIASGFRSIAGAINTAMGSVKTAVGSTARSIPTRAWRVASTLTSRLAVGANAGVYWFLGLALWQQLLIAVAAVAVVLGIAYLIYHAFFNTDSESDTRLPGVNRQFTV